MTTHPSHQWTWFIVEDDASIRGMLAAITTIFDIQPIMMPDGFSAQAWIQAVNEGGKQTEYPDLALLDIRLPGPNGDEIGEMLRKSPLMAEVPIVFMTAYHFDPAEERSIVERVHPAAILRKPLPDPQTLVGLLSEVITKGKTEKPKPLHASLSVISPTAPRQGIAVHPNVEHPPVIEFRETVRPVWLVLEDDPALSEAMRTIMNELWEVTPLAFSTADEAMAWLRKIEQERGLLPELAILDLRVPGEHQGQDFGAALRRHARTAHIPIVIATGYILSPENQHEIQEMVQPDLYLQKPYPESEVFHRMLEAVIKGRNLARS